MSNPLVGTWFYRSGSDSEGIRTVLHLNADGSYRKESDWVKDGASLSSAVELGQWSLSPDGGGFIEAVESFNGSVSRERKEYRFISTSAQTFVLRELKHSIERRFRRVEGPRAP